MKRLLVDTDVVSFLMRNAAQAELYRQHLEGALLSVSFVTLGELYAGAEKAGWGHRRRLQLENVMRRYVVLPYDVEVTRAFGKICAATHGAGRRIMDNDLWIAATAIAYGCALVTHNRRHFQERYRACQ